MNRLRLGLAAAGLALVTGAASAADDSGFKPLFNGKDLAGWVQPDVPCLFTIEADEIVGRTKDGQLKKNEFLVTKESPKNFVLKVKVKYTGVNSGIQFRSKRAEDGAVSGPQADIAEGFWGTLYEERGRGVLEQHPEAAALVKKGDWNSFVITAKGNHVAIELNGKTVIDRTDDKFDPAGVIGLQLHVGPAMEVRFKDMEIKTLE